MSTWNGMTADNIAQRGISTLEKKLIPMAGFSLDLSTEIPQGTTVSTRIVPSATAATDVTDDEGGSYASIVDSQTTTSVQVTLDPHPANGFSLTDKEAQEIAAGVWSDTSMRLVDTHTRGIAEDVLDSLFALVTNSNYGAAGITQTAANFDEDDVIDLAQVCTEAGWDMEANPIMVLNPGHYYALVKRSAIKDFSSSQSEALRTGTLPNIAGFRIVMAPTLPTNSENLAGFAALPDAMAIAMRGVDTQARNEYLAYEILQGDTVGAVMTYSAIYNRTYRRVDHIFESLYGVVKANTSALKRIVTA